MITTLKKHDANLVSGGHRQGNGQNGKKGHMRHHGRTNDLARLMPDNQIKFTNATIAIELSAFIAEGCNDCASNTPKCCCDTASCHCCW